jgi:hypothetical protein
MKVWFFLFLAAMLASVVILQTREQMTCSREVYGPTGQNSIYGPGDEPVSQISKHPGSQVRIDSAVEDDGKFSSDTATRNPQYLPVYQYSPPIERAFPVEEGGPQPFLNNFDKIGR